MGEKRVDLMRQMFSEGKTLREIGEAFGITKQRVSWLFAKAGVTAADGGHAVSLAGRYGFKSVDEFEEAKLMYPGCVKKFKQQKTNARVRGVEFSFTLASWLETWGPAWFQRGIGGDSLVMCRVGDVGPYAPGNVYIATCGQNAVDYQAKKRGRKEVDAGIQVLRGVVG